MGMRILLGTTNPSKAAHFAQLLDDSDVQVVTLADMGIDAEPEETGVTPDENAAIKAAFYGQYADRVICADSGLYFDALPLDDPRQPGLHVRTPDGRPRLNDEQMIRHYAALAASLGGRALAYYVNGVAVRANGVTHTFLTTREEAMSWAFYMTDTPSPWRREGWPLDSLSLDQNGCAFLDPARRHEPQQETAYNRRLRAFLKEALGL